MQHRTRPLSYFDRAGILIVAILGICTVVCAAMTTDDEFALCGAIFTSLFCGLLLYAWDQLANALRTALPEWFARFGRALRTPRSAQP